MKLRTVLIAAAVVGLVAAPLALAQNRTTGTSQEDGRKAERKTKAEEEAEKRRKQVQPRQAEEEEQPREPEEEDER